MSGMAVATWVSVAVLVAGSVLVFVWFLVDLVREARRRSEPDVGDDTHRAGADGPGRS